MKVLSALALALVATLSLIACGGDGGNDEPDPASPEQFAADVDAYCVERQEASLAALEPLGGPRAAADLEESMEQTEATLPVRVETAAGLGDFEPPEELAANWDEYLSAQDRIVASGEKAVAAGEEGDEAAYQKHLETASSAGEESRGVAADMGMTACAGELEPEQEEAVTAVVEEVETEASASQCTELFTQSYLDNFFGKEFGDKTDNKLLACEQFQEGLESSPAKLADRVEIASIQGPAPRAIAEVTSVGGENDGITSTWQLVEEGGQWKVNDIAQSG